MAPKTKVFHDGTAWLPNPWMDAAGAPTHRWQGHLTVIAQTKVAAKAALMLRGMQEGTAWRAVHGLRVMPPDPYFQPFRQVVDAGIINPAVPAVYVWWRGAKGDPIVWVEPDGTLTIIARLDLVGKFGGQLVAIPEPNTKEA